jgi:hypothetical protein
MVLSMPKYGTYLECVYQHMAPSIYEQHEQRAQQQHVHVPLSMHFQELEYHLGCPESAALEKAQKTTTLSRVRREGWARERWQAGQEAKAGGRGVHLGGTSGVGV